MQAWGPGFHIMILKHHKDHGDLETLHFTHRFQIPQGHFQCRGSCDGFVTPWMDKYSFSVTSLSHDLSGSHVESPELHLTSKQSIGEPESH